MTRKLLPVIVFFLVLLSAGAALADGDIHVGGPWGTRIERLPYTITAPGAYYLGGNLSYAGGGDGITIDTGINHVTLDLMGFTLNGSGSGHSGIFVSDSKNVEIRNGTVTGWGIGIRSGEMANLDRIINVRAVGNTQGIYLDGWGHLVQGCEVTATGSYNTIFVNQGTVSGCTVKFVDGYGIFNYGGITRDNVVLSTGVGTPRFGISTLNVALIKNNKVSGCAFGIRGEITRVNVIGNTVDAASGTTGISLSDDYSTLLDQNTVTGAGTHYSPSTFSQAAVRNNY